MREHILQEIRRLTSAGDGRAPGRIIFERETGIRPSEWRGKYWARWSSALAEAGVATNEPQSRLGHAFLMQKLAEALRHYGRVPTSPELRMYRQVDPTFPSHSTLDIHFRGKAAMLAHLREWAEASDEYPDVVAMIPFTPAAAAEAARPSDGFVYLLKSGEHYKVGRSDDVERRVKEITTALPETVNMVHAIRTDDPSGIESYWHRRFSSRRANGEWFKLLPGDVAAFKRRRYQ